MKNIFSDRSLLAIFIVIFALAYFMPMADIAGYVHGPILESLFVLNDYARRHILLCLIPAFLIAGAVGAFLSRATILRYLGAGANKVVAYAVASISGAILAVCSCTVLPLFASIHKRGAGLGPAIAFLYSGPAINVMAIVLTARVLGVELGIARAVAAITFSVVIGLLMHLIFLKEEREKEEAEISELEDAKPHRPLWVEIIFFAAMIAFLVFANLGIGMTAWYLASLALIVVIAITWSWFTGSEIKLWFEGSWWFAKKMLPLLFIGIIIAGFLLGRPGHEGVIPSHWVEMLVGGDSLRANFVAAFVGAFMYFATLTEVPILQGLIGAGMGKGPALALLLAGPALSLPNMLVIRGVMGTKRTITYVSIVIVMATISGVIYGNLF